MTKDEWKSKVSDLRDVLAERLLYSNTWDNVQLKVKKTFLEIKWFNTKKDDMYDPEGKVVFQSTRIAPLSKRSLWAEVDKQRKKLNTDKKNYSGDDDDLG